MVTCIWGFATALFWQSLTSSCARNVREFAIQCHCWTVWTLVSKVPACPALKLSQLNVVELKSGHSQINFPLLTLESFNNRDMVWRLNPAPGETFIFGFSPVCRRNPMFLSGMLWLLQSYIQEACLHVVLLAVLLHTCYEAVYFCTCRRIWWGI